MPLLKQLTDDLKEAMKSGDKARTEFIRFLLSHVHNREIEKRGKEGNANLTEEEVVDVLRKELKRKKESIDLFRKGGREDLVTKEKVELEMLTPYLPQLPTKEEIVKIVSELKGSGINDFAPMMKEAMRRLRGADGKAVSAVVKEALQ